MSKYTDDFKPQSLSEEQVGVLQHLLGRRFRVFIIGLIGVLYCWYLAGGRYLFLWYRINFILGRDEVDSKWADKIDTAFWGFVLFFIVLLAYFLHMLFKKILPLRKDVKEGIGFLVPMQIVRKSIPYEDRYFFFFDDLKIPYKEVDSRTYWHYQVGDTIEVLLARHSHMHVDEYMNFRLL